MALPIKITDAGKNAILNAQATGTNTVTLAAIAFGSGNYDPSTAGGMTTLQSEFKRLTTVGGQVVNPDTIHISVEDQSTDAYTVNEMGIFTDAGVLFAVYSQTSGSIMQKSASSILLLVTDILLSDVSATSITFGSVQFTNPPASETVQGVVYVATQTDVNTGTDDSKAVTPKKLKAVTDTLATKAQLAGQGVQVNGIEADITANATLDNTYMGKLTRFNAAAAITVTLPLADTFTVGQALILENVGAGTVTLAVQGSDTINANLTSMTTGGSLALVSDGGSRWLRLFHTNMENPHFSGTATAVTQAAGDSSKALATDEFVTNAVTPVQTQVNNMQNSRIPTNFQFFLGNL